MKCLVEWCIVETEGIGAERIVQAVRIRRVVDPVLVDDLCLEVLAVDEETNPPPFPFERVFVKTRVRVRRQVRRR